MERLNRTFYLQPTLIVAQELIGKNLCIVKNGQTLIGQIIETEAYLADDPASHAYKGLSSRNSAMFLIGGHTYVYLIYGRYFCLNLVTQPDGVPEAVLIRGLLPVSNLGKEVISGPGRVTQALDITLEENKIDTVTSSSIWIIDEGKQYQVAATPRIGISKAQEKLWRFVAVLK